MRYKIVYSDQVKAELEVAEVQKNKQRLNMIIRGVEKLSRNPLNTDNIIYGISGYFSEKASGQIRIFYSIHNAPEVIFITWINPETIPHNTNDGQDRDPCYREFLRLYNNSSLQAYIPAGPSFHSSASPIFTFKGNWGDLIIYAKTVQTNFFASAGLSLYLSNEENLNEYTIEDLKHNSASLADGLLVEIVARARAGKITLTYDLYLNQEINHLQTLRARLQFAGFKLFMADSSIETWILTGVS